MRRARIIGLALPCLLVAGGAWAHHDPFVLGTAQITHTVQIGDQVLPPGGYEVRFTGRHLEPQPGQPEESVLEFELVRGSTVVARDYAEVVPGPVGPAGTSGADTALRVELLRGGEFLRVSGNRGGQRYLVHLTVTK